jgi:phage gp29-like protein
VRLTSGGTSLTRAATVLRDPRIPASDADLRAQYEFAEAIEASTAQIAVARVRARRLGLSAILGYAPPANPDDSEGKPSHDFTSLRALRDAFDNLEQAVESADAAPTPDMRSAYARLSMMLARTLAKIPR